MRQILDLHIHSKYSRSCSPALTLENIAAACRIKGVDIIATGDFTYPEWFSDIKNKLAEIRPGAGLYKLKSAADDKIKFLLSTEVALIYKDGGKARRIHLVIHAPNVEAAEKLNSYLDKHFNIRSDGRPILGMSAPELMKLCLDIDKKFLIYPAHIWTPWFAVFGSKSGFDRLKDCFHEYTENIYALETGLSSDPAMNWRLSALDRLTILSNSDAHSLPNIAREANVFEMEEISYNEIYGIIKNKDLSKIKYTLEFYPEEGMYHYSGHRDHGVSFTPSQTKKLKGICPVCRKPLTVGVMDRVEELADRAEGFKPSKAAPFKKLVELDKIIAEVLEIKSRQSRQVQAVYRDLISQGGSELNILLDLSLKELAESAEPAVVEGIRRVREGKLIIKPGFDGQYGGVNIFSEREKRGGRQAGLFDGK
ncbi:MAG: endonuclease Q family protein [bacterium]|nr:endonuclease Q family protein [bacterium]